MPGSLDNYKAVLAYRETVPYYEPMVSRSSYSYHQGVFAFLYIELNRQGKEKSWNVKKACLYLMNNIK